MIPPGTTAVVTERLGHRRRHRRHLAAAGFDVVVGARRLDRLAAVAEPIRRALELDVTDDDSVARFCRGRACSLVVNNAGGALGLSSIADADVEQWRRMYDTNVLGTLRVTRGLLPSCWRRATATWW
jgi:NADP-dependent 3-hydroxy acid dehydrogenase YdfG